MAGDYDMLARRTFSFKECQHKKPKFLDPDTKVLSILAEMIKI